VEFAVPFFSHWQSSDHGRSKHTDRASKMNCHEPNGFEESEFIYQQAPLAHRVIFHVVFMMFHAI